VIDKFTQIIGDASGFSGKLPYSKLTGYLSTKGVAIDADNCSKSLKIFGEEQVDPLAKHYVF